MGLPTTPTPHCALLPPINNKIQGILLRLLRSRVLWVMLIAALWQIYFYRLLALPFEYIDTKSYLEASTNPRLLLGEIDRMRTPVYPCFIAAIRFFFGEENLLHRIVFFQQLISWCCIYFFFHTAKYLVRSTTVVVGTSLYCACHPTILGFNAGILTESLSVSGTIFLGFLLVSYVQRPCYGKAISIGIVSFLLIMLRPTFLVCLPVFFLFWIARLLLNRERRLCETVGLCSIIGALIFVLGYCQLFKQKHGEFGLTAVTYQANQFMIVLQSGMYRNGSDPLINQQLTALEKSWKKENPGAQPGEPWLFPTRNNRDLVRHIRKPLFCTPEGGQYAKDTIRKNRLRFAFYSLGKFHGMCNWRFDLWRHDLPGYTKTNPNFILKIRFQSVYVLLLLEVLVLGTAFYLTRRVPWFWCVCWLLIAGTIFTVVVGSYSDWSRLVIPALPLVILLIAKYVDLAAYVTKELCGKHVVQYLKEQSESQEGGVSQ